MINYSRQSIDQSDIDSVTEVLKSDFLTCGPKVPEFEEAIADYVGSKYAVAVGNCTEALHLSLLSAGIESGDQVITSPNTFAATANAILYVGAKPVFADINPYTYNVDPEDIERKITHKTRAIIPVHFAGRPCDMDEIHDLAKKYGLIVIEDAAHALSAEYKGQKIGSSKSDMTCFSFHPVKPICCGEGGIITTNSYMYYAELKALRDHGRINGKQIYLGYNYRMTNFQAALGISQLSKINWFWKQRFDIACYYQFQKLAYNKQITLPKINSLDCLSSWHLFVIQIPNRDKVKQYLNDRGIGAQIHYQPVYLHPYYQQLGYKKGLCPIAEDYSEHCLSLPLYPDLTREQQDYVIKTLEESLSEFRV
jgi:dTDP-4-amino-4,6-dideoxygalactose transaminase